VSTLRVLVPAGWKMMRKSAKSAISSAGAYSTFVVSGFSRIAFGSGNSSMKWSRNARPNMMMTSWIAPAMVRSVKDCRYGPAKNAIPRQRPVSASNVALRLGTLR